MHRAPADARKDSAVSSDLFRQGQKIAVICANPAGQITGFNTEAERIFSTELRQVIHQGIDILPEALRDAFVETSKSGNPVHSREISVGDQTAYRGYINTIITRGEKGELREIVLLLHLGASNDLLSKVQHLESLAAAGTLAASMAHEIKNALVGIKTFFELIAQKNPEAELIDIARAELQRIEKISRQLLQLNQCGEPQFGPVPVHDVLSHCLSVMGPELKARDVSLHLRFHADADLITGNRNELQQLFLNMFLNALEAMDNKGELGVTTATAGDKFLITIEDTGPGIPEEHRERIFEPFVTTKTSGTGLGLPICRRIVEAHQGDIFLDNAYAGGAKFDISFPLIPAN